MKKMIIGLTIGMLIGSSAVAVAATSPKVQATLVKYRIVISGETKQVKANQLSYNGNTYIQLREAGSLFGYNASYDAASKTITFNSKNSSKKWISLTDFAAESKLKVEMDAHKKDVYNIMRGNDIITTLIATDLKENEERGSSTNTNGVVIYFTKQDGLIMLNSESLKKAGLL